MKLTDDTINQLINAAALAPSADNMQPWEFRKTNGCLDVFYVKNRSLPTDTLDMFGFISVGAAIQNIVLKARELGFSTKINYNISDFNCESIASLSFEKDDYISKSAMFLSERNTNRCPYKTNPLTNYEILKLTDSIKEFDSGIFWTTNIDDYKQIARLDANSSYIRLEFKPFHDELFHILRFTKKDNEKFRFGLTFDSLEVPKFAVKFAQMLKYHSVNTIVAKLGFGKLVAKQLSEKLTKSGALCLITVKNRNKVNYIESGRALEQLWITATEMGLSIQPYGVLPQYFTKLVTEPSFFPPKYSKLLNEHILVFYRIFQGAVNQSPAILLRVGYSDISSKRSSIRLHLKELLKK